MIRIASYASPLERVWYHALRAFSGLVLVFLMLPILMVAPLTLMSTLMLVTLERLRRRSERMRAAAR